MKLLTLISRFIPTAVGNAPSRCASVRHLSVHPHGCGERGFGCQAIASTTGSSPRLWGTLFHSPLSMPEFRFIPTAVGNATASDRRPFCISVHPHGCGERGGFLGHSPNVVGSSPRLWGTLHTPWGMESGSRFIPTAVGNALQAVAEKNLLSVHPLGCGERFVSHSAAIREVGSSPRLWGTRIKGRTDQERQWFIPTAVGNAN